MPWEYDPGERRDKHKWSKREPGFTPSEGDNAIGKCPSTITNAPGLAKQLLNSGVAWPPDENPPGKIYNVHMGVIYRAEPTLEGVSYHGFPEKETKSRRVPQEILMKLAEKADDAGEFDLFRKWMRKHLSEGWKRLKYKPKRTIRK